MEQDKQASSQAVTPYVKQPYKPVRKRAVYHHDHDFEATEMRCMVSDAMDNTGGVTKSGSNAFARRRCQISDFVYWLCLCFPSYYRDVSIISRSDIQRMIALCDGSVLTLVQILNPKVYDQSKKHRPIDNPVAWCRKCVERWIEDEQDKLTRREAKRLADEQIADMKRIAAVENERKAIEASYPTTEVPNETKQIPEKTALTHNQERQEFLNRCNEKKKDMEQQADSKPKQVLMPWEKPQLPDTVWFPKYDDELARGLTHIQGLSVRTLEPASGDDTLLCTGKKRKDVNARLSMRSVKGSPVDLTPMEKEFLYPTNKPEAVAV